MNALYSKVRFGINVYFHDIPGKFSANMRIEWLKSFFHSHYVIWRENSTLSFVRFPDSSSCFTKCHFKVFIVYFVDLLQTSLTPYIGIQSAWQQTLTLRIYFCIMLALNELCYGFVSLPSLNLHFFLRLRRLKERITLSSIISQPPFLRVL